MNDLWSRRTAALLCGGISGIYLPAAAGFWVMGILLLVLVRLWLWRPQDFWGRVYRPEIFITAVGVLAGFVYGLTVPQQWPEPFNLKYIQLSGTLLDWSETSAKATGVFEVEEGAGDQEIVTGLRGQKYRLTVYPKSDGQLPAAWQQVQPGDHLRFAARLEQPRSQGTAGAFDLRLYYAVRGLQGSLTAQDEVIIAAQGSPPLTWLIRKQVMENLRLWDRTETGVLEGIIFGDASGISSELQERYRATGVLHIFAASGSNVAVVLGLLWFLTVWLPLRLRLGMCSAGLIGYAALCDGNAPILRATILGIAVLLGRLGWGRVPPLRWLLLAALILFVHNPLLVRDLGFQLSFIATWGIIVLGPRIQAWQVFHYFPRQLAWALAGTLAAQIAVMPLIITAFHRLSLVSLLANLAVMVLVGTVLELGLIAVMLSYIPVLAAPFWQVSLWLLQISNAALAQLALLPWAEVMVMQPGVGFWLGWFGGITVWLAGRERLAFIARVYCRKLWRRLLFNHCQHLYPQLLNHLLEPHRTKFVNLTGEYGPLSKNNLSWLLIALLTILLWSPWGKSTVLEVTFLDVGQGDCIIIQTPEQQAIMVDSGPQNEQFDSGAKIIVPYLLHEGIKNLAALLLTHEHQDHLGGAQTVLENIPVAWVGVPAVDQRLSNQQWSEGLTAGIQDSSERFRLLQSGDKIVLDSGIFLEVLAPRKVLEGTSSDPNNNSLVLRLNYQESSVLLTGDMEQEEMATIADAGLDYEADFFKQPHHGSTNSLAEPWLDAIQPRAVIISVGKNSFGHPSPQVLQYWAGRQIPIYRTDQDGTIRLRLDPQGGAEIISGRAN
ncbi:MAG TPA: ComEC/Rec2 family competence protein [Desulfitobacteriaceae bacterium]|nr:ComEC/Rec2 family competence protein [Desulfitobacteriaceae bacterium]